MSTTHRVMTEVLNDSGRRLDSHYTLLDKLGAGGQGEVRRAHDEVRGVDVALKIVRTSGTAGEAAYAALQREYEIAGRLDHPAILKVFSPEHSTDFVALPMELAAGGDMRRLRGAGYLEIVPILIEVAQALDHAHHRGVVHRDLKPGNVLFDVRGRVKLADFGVAGVVSSEAGTANHGLSPFTASPEQLRGESPKPTDDIYGLGALAYELLSGHPPYYPQFDVMRAMHEPVPELVPTRQIPPVLKNLVTRMLAKKAADRPGSMSEVLDELEASLNDTLAFEFDNATVVLPGPILEPTLGPTSGPPPTPRAPPASTAAPVAPRGAAASDFDIEFSTSIATPIKRVTPAPQAEGAAAARAVPIHDFTPLELPEQVQAVRKPLEKGPELRLVPGNQPDSKARAKAAWDDLQLGPLPRVAKLEPIRSRRSPWIVVALLIGIAFAVVYALPRIAPGLLPPQLTLAVPVDTVSNTASNTTTGATEHKSAVAPISRLATPVAAAADAHPGSTQSALPPIAATAPAAANAGDAQKLKWALASFDNRMTSLDIRGAGVWGEPEFADARMLSAQSIGARDAGDQQLALSRLNDATHLLDKVERKIPQALAAQLDAADRALAAGQTASAAQAIDLARRIDPNNPRVVSGERRVHSVGGVTPLLTDAENAERSHNYSRAAQDYGQALSLDPGNVQAQEGLARANAAFGDDGYAKAVGVGFAALGAGRLDEAHDSFEKARTYKLTGVEAAEGLRRVGAAMGARNSATVRQRAAAFEAQERWDDAVREYDNALKADPSLQFAQLGKARARERADLANRLQEIIDHPERLTTTLQRDEARSLLETARSETVSGPVLRSQIARMEGLIPEFDRPQLNRSQVNRTVRLSLISDNATQVAIPSIGAFGHFGHRDIDLKPGRYTVIGTRTGFRDVRRDITVAPGESIQTISVTCSDPI